MHVPCRGLGASFIRFALIRFSAPKLISLENIHTLGSVTKEGPTRLNYFCGMCGLTGLLMRFDILESSIF